LSKTPEKSPEELVAAVDLGSNSFRMVIARVLQTPSGTQVQPIDTLRESVRLAAGLTQDKKLDEKSISRGLKALHRFGDRLKNFDSKQVRVVATNTLRVARNADTFIKEAEKLLGFPIEVVAGREEARLIYIGAAHDAPTCDGRRFVLDIGGGSTEFIIGDGYEPKLLESLYIGCVSFSQQYFPDGLVDAHSFKQAQTAARREIQAISTQFKKMGWKQSIGSSGTARAIAELIALNGFDGIPHDLPVSGAGGVITHEGLQLLKKSLIDSEYVDKSTLIGLKGDRKPVLPGGLAIMIAAFEELDINRMEVTEAALRLGVLYDLMGRSQHHDMRFVTVEQFMQRYGVDRQQAKRVSETAVHFLNQFPKPKHEDRKDNLHILSWAAKLHEIGLTISHNGYHKHSAYIASHADMPGFSRLDQARLAALLLGHTGKLGKISVGSAYIDWRMLFCLRLAHVICRRRDDEPVPDILVKEIEGGYLLKVSKAWAKNNPLTQFGLEKESADWQKIGREFQIEFF
jgi:exopolyphosphatase / guanosine-5'-triphosphate,3'-diphosphate pyrophosphatase